MTLRYIIWARGGADRAGMVGRIREAVEEWRPDRGPSRKKRKGTLSG